MLRKSILVLGSAIAVGLVALAGIAVAEIASDDAGTSAMDVLVVRSTTTMIDDHGESAPTESTTTSTTTMGDDEYDDEYDDDSHPWVPRPQRRWLMTMVSPRPWRQPRRRRW